MYIYQVAPVFTLLLMTLVNITNGQITDGAIYTRWGRRSCPDDAELIYEGYAGGSHYDNQGGGSNYLCLPIDPIFRLTDQDRGDRRAEVYGAEYKDPPKSQLHEHQAPCVVCQVTRRSALMMPGTNLCKEGWTTEYVGYVASARTYESRHPHEFVCMDEDVEPTSHSKPELDGGAIFYPAQTICGYLPCLPYVEGKDLLCVVCSR